MKKDNWILKIFIITFILSIAFSGVSSLITAKCNDFVLFIIVLLVTLIGILFDMIGTSAMTAKEATFHSMNSRKVKGASEVITLIKNRDRIASICNDVVGDVCGIISGGLGAVLAISLSVNLNINSSLTSVLIAAFISSITVGGKAICKSISIKNADKVLFFVGKVKHMLKLK